MKDAMIKIKWYEGKVLLDKKMYDVILACELYPQWTYYLVSPNFVRAEVKMKKTKLVFERVEVTK